MYKWIDIVLEGKSPSGKTSIWNVSSKDGIFLGQIRWFGRWRQYTFWPDDNTVWNKECLNEVADFLTKARQEHE